MRIKVLIITFVLIFQEGGLMLKHTAEVYGKSKNAYFGKVI